MDDGLSPGYLAPGGRRQLENRAIVASPTLGSNGCACPNRANVWNGVFDFASGNPHDMDGVADHVSGVLLAFWPLGIGGFHNAFHFAVLIHHQSKNDFAFFVYELGVMRLQSRFAVFVIEI
jgi:hypothetical protein